MCVCLCVCVCVYERVSQVACMLCMHTKDVSPLYMDVSLSGLEIGSFCGCQTANSCKDKQMYTLTHAMNTHSHMCMKESCH